jgi:dTMP kinase
VKRGSLLAFEGLDGSGKSTQIARCARALAARGIDLVQTFEPTDGEMGRRIRAMARSGDTVAPEEELRWFWEDRREHVDEVIEPALVAGRWVLTDRYFLSSVAYQGARGLDPGEILRRSEGDFPLPDLALVFELPAAAGLARVRARAGIAEPAFERLDFLERVEAIFEGLDRPYIARLDANREPEAIEVEVLAVLRARLGI